MSQKDDDSENDIWEYKPLQKKNKRLSSSNGAVAKKRRNDTSSKTAKRDISSPAKPSPRKSVHTGDVNHINHEEHCRLEAQTLPSQTSPANEAFETETAPSGDFCPICQMPFSILVVQTQRWHVAECLDTPRDKNEECPDGLRCSSTIPNHYKRYSHALLAHSRATNDPVLLCLSQEGGTSLSGLPRPTSSEVGSSILDSSQDSTVNLSALSSHSTTAADSPVSNHSGTPPTKLTNGLLLLRSPGPEDFKKKKGWWPRAKGQKPASASQESKTQLSSTPLKPDSGGQACEGGFVKTELSPYNDMAISYSPLSELPAEFEVDKAEPRKALFPENEDQDSMMLFSEDELLCDFMNDFDSDSELVEEHASSVSNTQLEPLTSLAPCHQPATSTADESTPNSTRDNEAHGKTASTVNPCKISLQSPQSIVLECLRETLSSSNNPHCKSLTDCSGQPERPSTLPHHVPSSQTSISQASQTIAPRKGQSKAGQVSGLKQLDIGVFFGLKPLKEKKEEAVENTPLELNSTDGPRSGGNLGQRGKRGDRQRKSRAARTRDARDDGGVVNVQEEGGSGGARAGRRGSWNRVKTDGAPRYCPFYKKIPGTKFAVDAFCYGEIEGISAYFLTHFHSDHYGGLKKSSTLPIYCNRITGNLVKSKLKVAEQYVHILPMNTQVTVEGVGVILLDANHCPGSAMLLFFLPGGQTVLHTGDFRADPSMETYPELLSCRVQTLYLDTTYCSPEYTFPSQHEVISFAANVAFELVTLNPRTLVVCGSYSVGKEKVFLALAEVLGSKVCLSRDKYNTMCCLESERITQLITTDWKAAQVHVLPMIQLGFKKLQAHLSRYSGQYEQLVAFKPTGWTFSQQVDSVEDIQPYTSGNITIYGIPYSEHSSFLEMKRFVQWLQPLKIIPTVNNGSRDSRREMEKCFGEWLMETKTKLKP